MSDKIKLSKKREPVERFIYGDIVQHQGRSFEFDGYRFHIVEIFGTSMWSVVESQTGFIFGVPDASSKRMGINKFFGLCIEFLEKNKDKLDNAVIVALKERTRLTKKGLTKY